jgi:GTP-binding protein
MSFTVAIVGRPNVGKSTLFNRLVGRAAAIVDPTPGVTRDRREGEAAVGPLAFTAVDTAGYEESDPDSLAGRARKQTETAIDQADVALFVIDARAGITPLDRAFARALRRRKTPVILIANKCEGDAGEAGVLDAFALGLGEAIPVSAAHGEGLAELYRALAPFAADAAAAPAPDGPLKLAIVGRPNVGKSTLVNRLLGEERMVTSPLAGTTRDAVTIAWEFAGRPFQLIDTAGQRRRSKVDDSIEARASADARRAIDLAHVVVLVVDATQTLDKQDLTIARHTIEQGRALVVAANKWDLVEDRQRTRRALDERLVRSLAQGRGVPVVAVSALTGAGIDRLLPAVIAIFDLWNARVATAKLNDWLAHVEARHPPPAVDGRPVRLRYATQVKTRPPTFVVFLSRSAELAGAYVRYLENELRSAFALPGVPIRILPRKGKNPFAPRPVTAPAKRRQGRRARAGRSGFTP